MKLHLQKRQRRVTVEKRNRGGGKGAIVNRPNALLRIGDQVGREEEETGGGQVESQGVGMEPEQRGRASRASSTSSLGREVRCGCQYYQSDSLLPERRALLGRPPSRTMQQPLAVRCRSVTSHQAKHHFVLFPLPTNWRDLVTFRSCTWNKVVKLVCGIDSISILVYVHT